MRTADLLIGSLNESVRAFPTVWSDVHRLALRDVAPLRSSRADIDGADARVDQSRYRFRSGSIG